MVVGAPAPTSDAAIWHQLECGSYTADLPLWRELARAHPDTPILDIGAGTGRVSIDLARSGRQMIALDNDQLLLRELLEREPHLGIRTVCADARHFQLQNHEPLRLCLVPMQTVQLLGGREGRLALLGCVREHVADGGLLALAIVTEVEDFDCRGKSVGPSPELARHGDVVYRSRAVRVSSQHERIVIERHRSMQTPSSSHSERNLISLDRLSAEQLIDEAACVGLRPAGVRVIAPTEEHAGSEVVMLSG
jgi:SAM-dependent methyltransferase